MKIIKIFILATLFLNANLTKIDNRVIDDKTNLQWQDDGNVSTTKTNWKDAINFCENLELDNYKDWRLPNIVELSSIIDDTKNKPLISNIFKNNKAADFWSSTTKANDSNSAWIVIFNKGIQYFRGKSEKNYVRCVRGGI